MLNYNIQILWNLLLFKKKIDWVTKGSLFEKRQLFFELFWSGGGGGGGGVKFESNFLGTFWGSFFILSLDSFKEMEGGNQI